MFGAYTKAIIAGLGFIVEIGRVWIESGAPPVVTMIVGAIATFLTYQMANKPAA